MSVNQSNKSSASQECVVRVPKDVKLKHTVLKFNSFNNIDISSWRQVKMERENNVAEFKSEIDDVPKFGAGSIYNRELKELAKKKKYGMSTKRYNPDEQPWTLKVGGKNSKRYRGVREGGILDNASYYIFTEASDGAFEAFPVDEWYNFTPVARYKTLNAEEAEEEFGRRDKVLNYFSIMVKKKCKTEDDEEDKDGGDAAGEKSGKSGTATSFKISEIDDWTDASDADDSDDHDSDAKKDKSKKPKKKVKKRAPTKTKQKKKGTDDEAEEDSDEFDEGQEVDYISDDTSSSEDGVVKDKVKVKDELKGVEDEEALRIFDASDEEDEEENKEDKEDETNGDKNQDKNKGNKNKKAANKKESSSDTSSDSSDSDNIDSNVKSAMFIQKANKSKNNSDNSASSSRANTPTSQLSGGRETPNKPKKEKGHLATKRKHQDDTREATSSPISTKKLKQDLTPVEGLNDESIRRYLMRKPITAAELLQKFKSKKCGMTTDQLATTIAAILKRLNPKKETIKGKIYWSLKP